MGAVTRMQIAELQERSEGDEHWFAGVCADIVNGASVDEAYANLCAMYDVSWGAVSAWIHAPSAPERKQQWEAALAARKLLRQERAAANVARIAQVEHDKAKVGVSDTLKAAGMVLEEADGKKGGGGVTVIVQRGGTEPPRVGYSGDGKTLTIGEI